MTLVSVRDVRFGYHDREVLAGLSFDVAEGEGVALLGANGAGKTTLLRLLMAFHQPWSGTVEVGGRALRGLFPEELAGTAGYLFQRPEDQLFRRTVREDVRFGPERLGWSAERSDAAVTTVFEELGLSGMADQHPYDLPLPRRRLVALAGVFAMAPRILLLDEPTATLDRAARALVVAALRARRAAGAAIVAITHDIGFAIEVCSRATTLDGGRCVADGPIREVLDRPGAPPLPPAAALIRRLGVQSPSLHWDDLVSALAARCRDLQE